MQSSCLPALTSASGNPKHKGLPRGAYSNFVIGPRLRGPVRTLFVRRETSKHALQDPVIDHRSVTRCSDVKTIYTSRQRVWHKNDKANGPTRPHFIVHIIRYHSHHMPCSISEALRNFLRQRKTQHCQNFLRSNARAANSIKTLPPIPAANDFCRGFALFL